MATVYLGHRNVFVAVHVPRRTSKHHKHHRGKKRRSHGSHSHNETTQIETPEATQIETPPRGSEERMEISNETSNQLGKQLLIVIHVSCIV